MNIPLQDIISKIKENSGLTEEEINNKIKEKLESLSGLISKEGAAHIIANELGVKLVQTEGTVPIKNLLAGMRNVEVAGQVTQKWEVRQFSKGERKGSVASLVIADSTGSIRLVFWNDQTDNFVKINEGDILKIESGFVKENQGRKEIHLNSATKLEINPANVKIEINTSPERKKLADLKENDENVEVLGTVVQVFDPRFFEVCEKCGKRLSKKENDFVCDVHGVLKPDYAYVMNLFLDDGTSNIRTVLWRQQAQKLLEKTDEEIKVIRESPAEFEKIRSELLGQFIKIVGRVKKNEGFDSLELVANLVYPNPDPKKELDALKSAPQEETDSQELMDAVGEKSDGKKKTKTLKPAVPDKPPKKPKEKSSDKKDDFEEVISIDDLEDVEE
ncbi:MAG: hypothetical protein KKG59_07935 [Nanoarchaeota archaeon]|nr:hypothetical protein [Nanoarchaeota archaeon]